MFKQKVVELLAAVGFQHPLLEKPDLQFGDVAVPCFSLAKEWKKAPQQIAIEITEKLRSKQQAEPKQFKWLSEINSAGAYINFKYNQSLVANEVITTIRTQKKKYGYNQEGNNKTVMVEFSSPNTGKPMHLGHVRNNCLGRAVSNLLSASGYRVLRASLMNDRGAHMAKAMVAYQHWGERKTPASSGKKGDHFLGELYVKFKQEAEKNPILEEEAATMLRAWEAEDKKTIALWKKLLSWCVNGFNQTYKEMGIKFDVLYWESKLWKQGAELVDLGLQKGVMEKLEDGAIKATLEQYGIPDKVVRRSDGTSLYITQDLYVAKSRFDERNLDRIVYVVACEQDLHFKQLFKILELMGFTWAKKCYHLSYGMVALPDGVMKSREGRVVDADDLMKEMQDLAKKEVSRRYPDISEEELTLRGRAIGLGALTFFMLRLDPVKELMYDPKASISFEGETGPYVQYSHARICSIFEKHEGKIPKIKKPELLTHQTETALVTLLTEYPAIVLASTKQYDIHTLCHYLLQLATETNAFYGSCQVLNVEANLRDARLALLDAVRIVLKNGLGLLGIEAPQRM